MLDCTVAIKSFIALLLLTQANSALAYTYTGPDDFSESTSFECKGRIWSIMLNLRFKNGTIKAGKLVLKSQTLLAHCLWRTMGPRL